MTTLTNISSGPVELHLTAGVTVLRPRERLDADPADLELGQVRALCRQGVLQQESTVDQSGTRRPKRGRSERKKES
ncbi:hypothetical protein [Actinophytocola sp.]|uniref:hypothetical protein n=1 Tax=Actinophytocola sp. TaxID=1872138 RepID=UPI003899E059